MKATESFILTSTGFNPKGPCCTNRSEKLGIGSVKAFLAMKKKTAYRTCNWPEFNRALKQRGSPTVWISKDARENWTTKELPGEPGASADLH
ncbi:MAG: hypothetical protein U0X75_17210 [Acidobacteriota bacterium]